MSEAQQGVNAVEIAVTVLRYIAAQPASCRAIDVAASCGLSKSRLHKYLVSLCRTGMLYQDENGHYAAGPALSLLASGADKMSTIISRSEKRLRHLRDNINYSTGLVLPVRDGLMMHRYFRSFRHVDIDFLDNTPVPVSTSAAGMIYRCFHQAICDDNEEDGARKIRQQGFSVRTAPVQCIPGVQAIACPILDTRQRLVAIGVVMGFFEGDKEIERIAQALKKALAALKE